MTFDTEKADAVNAALQNAASAIGTSVEQLTSAVERVVDGDPVRRAAAELHRQKAQNALFEAEYGGKVEYRETIRNITPTISRNAKCHCGSGKKRKHCCKDRKAINVTRHERLVVPKGRTK